MKNSFFIKEQRWANPAEFIEPDDEAIKDREAGKHLVEYIDQYRGNPRFLEEHTD